MTRAQRIAGLSAVVLTVSLLTPDAVSSRGTSRWPQFRGPQSLGIADGASFPERWSATENVAWVADVPGRGWSSPVVWDDKVFVTSALDGNGTPEQAINVEWRLYCYQASTGRRLWDAALHTGRPFTKRHLKNTYASETPVTDGKRVYVYLGNIGLFAYSLDGRRLWSTPIEPHAMYLDFGTSSSPILLDGRVLVLNDNQESSWLAAYDGRTGRQVWRTPRDFGKADVRSSFSTPFIWKTPSRTEVVTMGPTAMVSYDRSGRELWRVRGLGQIAAPTAVAAGELLIAGSGAPGEKIRPMLAVRHGAAGDITLADGAASNASVAWYQERGGPYITSPLAYGGRVYVLFDQGFIGATDLATGRVLYKARIGEGGVAFSASPWAANGRIFCLSEDGDTYVIEAGDEYKLLATNRLDEMSLATPAVVGDGLFIRTATKLYRIGRGMS